MKRPQSLICPLFVLALTIAPAAQQPPQPQSPQPSQPQERRYLYVAVPGIENGAETGGVALDVFDIDKQHQFVKRIPIWADDPASPEGVRGIAVNGTRLYLSTTKRLAALDLRTNAILWEHDYGGHCCDRMAISPDGRILYVPAFGKPVWYVIEASNGSLLSTVSVMGWPRSTIYSRDGRHAYLAAWESPILVVADAVAHKTVKEIGPFSDSLCPFTVNGRETLAFANVDGLVGFEVGDLSTGLILDRVVVEDYAPEEVATYECPSHGIALTSDERELWVADGVGNRLRVFDATTYPPVLKTTIDLAIQPRWISFSMDGRYAYPSTGDVIDASTTKIVATLEDGQGVRVQSEKLLEIDFVGGGPFRAGEQTARGARR